MSLQLNNVQWVMCDALNTCTTQHIRNMHDAVIVFYFAHGLGDFVMFNNIVPFLNCNNNKLYITRAGDDYIALQEGSEILRPLYTGINTTAVNDGATLGSHHFQIAASKNKQLKITPAMKKELERISCTHFCVEHFYERHGGHYSPPYHSKPRMLLHTFSKQLTTEEKLQLNQPLPSAVYTGPNPLIDHLVDLRLRAFTPHSDDTKIIVITRYGATSCGKNWGHLFRSAAYPKEGDEARHFIDICRAKNSNTVFISMEHREIAPKDSIVDHSKNSFSFAELFSPLTHNEFAVPYAVLLMALFRKAAVHVGCATGASGVATLFNNLRNILVWPELFPSWYFEPTDNTINVIGSNNILSRKSCRNSFDSWADLHYNNVYVDTPHIPANIVFELVESCL